MTKKIQSLLYWFTHFFDTSFTSDYYTTRSYLYVLKYSIPDYIKNDKDLSQKIHKIENANPKDGGEGAISIFLKANRYL